MCGCTIKNILSKKNLKKHSLVHEWNKPTPTHCFYVVHKNVISSLYNERTHAHIKIDDLTGHLWTHRDNRTKQYFTDHEGDISVSPSTITVFCQVTNPRPLPARGVLQRSSSACIEMYLVWITRCGVNKRLRSQDNIYVTCRWPGDQKLNAVGSPAQIGF